MLSAKNQQILQESKLKDFIDSNIKELKKYSLNQEEPKSNLEANKRYSEAISCLFKSNSEKLDKIKHYFKAKKVKLSLMSKIGSAYLFDKLTSHSVTIKEQITKKKYL